MAYRVNEENVLLYFAPIVFGIISEKIRIKIVKIADTNPIDVSPNNLAGFNSNSSCTYCMSYGVQR